MAVGDLSTNVLDAQLILYSGLAVPGTQILLARGSGSTIFVGAFSIANTSGGARRIDLATYNISTAGIVTATPLDQITLSTAGTAGARSFDLISHTSPGVVIVGWGDINDSNSPRISTYSINSTGGLTLIANVEADSATSVSGSAIYLTRINSDVYLLSYRRLASVQQGFGVTFSVSSTGGITIPIDGPETMESGGLVIGNSHPAAWVLSSILIADQTSGIGLRTYPMTAGGSLSTSLFTSTSYEIGSTNDIANLVTLDSGLGIVALGFGRVNQKVATVIVNSTGGISTFISSSTLNTVGLTAVNQRMIGLGSRGILVMEDNASPARIRTFVSDALGVLTTVGTMTSTGILAARLGPSFAHVSGNVMAVAAYHATSSNSLVIATFNAENELTPDSVLSINILVDWNNDGVFSSTEDISSDCLRFSWRRGREAEQGETPAGTATIELKDPNGDYSPHKSGTKWGAGNVTINREVLARATYGATGSETTYGLFRGRIQTIKPHISAEEQRASIFCIDGMDELNLKVFSTPIGDPSSGGILASFGGPLQDVPIGTTAAGVIETILDGSSWPGGTTGRMVISETGPTLGWWWSYNQSAKSALNAVESHDPGSIIFINSTGNVQYVSSTHFIGSTQVASFGSTDISAWDYEFSARSLFNVSEITSHSRIVALSTDVGHINTTSLPTMATNSTLWVTIELSHAPSMDAFTPIITKNGSTGLGAQLAIVDTAVGGTGGSTLTTDRTSIFGRLVGASAMVCFINNLTTLDVRVQAPEGAATTTIAMWVPATTISDDPITSSYSDSTYIDQYKRRVYSANLPFLDQVSDAQTLAQRIVDRHKQPQADFAHMSIEMSSTYNLGQILTREIGDKIRATVSDLGISSRDYLIYSGEWEIVPGNSLGLGYHMGVNWGLVESSGNSTTT